MGACLSFKCGRSPTEGASRTPDASLESASHPERETAGPRILSNYRDLPASCEEIQTFYSFEKEESRFISVDSMEELGSQNLTDGHHEPRNRPRRVLKCGRTGEFYGYRDRIPSHVDGSTHDENYWWSAANLSRPVILNDLGANPQVLSRPIKVTVVPSSFFASHRDIEVFPEYLSLCRSLEEMKDTSSTVAASSICRGPSQEGGKTVRLIVFKLKMGEQVMVSLNEVIQEDTFDRVFKEENRTDLLQKKLKLILSPINLPLPLPAKKPRDAETVGSYFGMDNVDLYIDGSMGEVKVASILINIYSKWIIRKFLPLVTASHGRICDFILLSSDDQTVFADFRLLSTQVSQALIKGNTNR